MATETQALYSPVSSMSSHSSSSGRLSLPRLKTMGNSNLQPYSNSNSNELSAISCSSAVSQIIGQYIYTPLTATPERYEQAKVEKQLYWEEKKETVEDMIYALDRVLGMAPGSNVGSAVTEAKQEIPVVKVEVKVEKQEPYWGEQKESVEDMINALNRVIERGSMGTLTLDGYTPLTATAENFMLDIQAEPEMERQLKENKDVPVYQEEKEESAEERVYSLNRVLSTASMDIPVGLEELLYEHAQGKEVLPKRQSGVRRGSKVPVSARLSQLRGNQTAPRKAGTSALYDSPIDWAPIQRMAVRNSSEPLSALSPQSCITDAFREDTRWSSIHSGQGQGGRSGYDSYAVDIGEDDWETTGSCTETCIDDDDITSPCETVTNWDGLTIIDDDETATSIVDEREDYSDDYICETPTTIIIAPPPPTTAPPALPPAAISREDPAKDLMSPIISCRVGTVANLDFPAYIPSPMPTSGEQRPSGTVKRSTTDTQPFPSPRSPPPQRPMPHIPSRAGTDPLTISRQVMRQEWTETPLMKLDLAKLDSIPPTPPRSTTPNSRPGTGTSAGRKENPLPWLTSRSASPARSIEEIKKTTAAGQEAKRTRSPRGWKLW